MNFKFSIPFYWIRFMKRYRYVTRLSKCWKIENGFLSIVQVSAEDILRIHLPRKKNKQTKSIDALFSWSDSLEMYLGTFPKLDSSPFPFFGDYGKPRLRWTREAFWNTQTQKNHQNLVSFPVVQFAGDTFGRNPLIIFYCVVLRGKLLESLWG